MLNNQFISEDAHFYRVVLDSVEIQKRWEPRIVE